MLYSNLRIRGDRINAVCDSFGTSKPNSTVFNILINPTNYCSIYYNVNSYDIACEALVQLESLPELQ